MRVVAIFNMKPDIPVIQQQIVTRFQCGKNLFMRQIDTGFVTRRAVHVQHEFLAVFQFDFIILKQTDAKLWPLHVRHNRNMQIFLFRQLPYNIVALFVLGMRSVAEIETKSIRSGIN